MTEDTITGKSWRRIRKQLAGRTSLQKLPLWLVLRGRSKAGGEKEPVALDFFSKFLQIPRSPNQRRACPFYRSNKNPRFLLRQAPPVAEMEGEGEDSLFDRKLQNPQNSPFNFQVLPLSAGRILARIARSQLGDSNLIPPWRN